MDSQRYEPRQYWSRRLQQHPGLRGTGHISYSDAYNAWLYRAKGRALRRGLAGIEPGPALDIGAGGGWAIELLEAHRFSVEGCDIAPQVVARLRERFPGRRFFEHTVGSEPIPRDDGSFQLVSALDVLYHVTDDAAWVAALREASRVIRPSGRLIVTDGFGATAFEPTTHVRFRSREQWQVAASEAGLQVERELPLYRWLSRDPGRFSVLPDGTRGAIEYSLERLVPRRPHMRLVVFRRR